MKPLYLATAVREGLGASLRPGGDTLTRRILQLTSPAMASTVLDAGCGLGTSMRLLRQYGIRTVIGLDLEAEFLGEARLGNFPVARADLQNLPLTDACLDMLLCECVWNLTDRHRTLGEFARTLRPGGYLALTDIFARSQVNSEDSVAWPVPCCFSGATGLPAVAEMVGAAGFEILVLEDHSRLLTHTAAEFVFAHGSLQAFWQAVTGDAGQASAACAASAATRPGLFLLIAKRSRS
ncbi:MAG: class I SAM-dependent methyltransferase [Desulforhopalus sp.]|nr:class I SAM-dependent methyltransferase [Desulforhopalus sp.]